MQHKNFSLDTILNNLNIDALNPMQTESIEASQQHKNIVLLSDTGSGKTLAFLLPILERLDLENKNTQALCDSSKLEHILGEGARWIFPNLNVHSKLWHTAKTHLTANKNSVVT